MKTILLVDDEVDILKVIGARLRKAGYKVLTAAEGKAALMLLDRETPDLIILDIMMPGMDGFEVLGEIKKRRELNTVPTIFFTARTSLENKVEGLKMGVHDYLTKPIDNQELLAKIASILKINERYINLSLKDELTGCYNHHVFKRQFAHSFNLASRYKRFFSLVIVDVDDLKKINDTQGHLCGDFVLKSVAQSLTNYLRKVDVITRYGGDEFAIILPETDGQRAKDLVERLKSKIGSLKLVYSGKKINVGLSFGFASYNEQTKTKENLYNIADQDMYSNKKKKKMRITK